MWKPVNVRVSSFKNMDVVASWDVLTEVNLKTAVMEVCSMIPEIIVSGPENDSKVSLFAVHI